LQPGTPHSNAIVIYRLGGEFAARDGDAETGHRPVRRPGETIRSVTRRGGLQLFGLSQATNPTASTSRIVGRGPHPNYSATSGGRDKLIRDYFVFFPVATVCAGS
jgi:hypothetical protein